MSTGPELHDHHEDPPLGSSLTTCDLVSHAPPEPDAARRSAGRAPGAATSSRHAQGQPDRPPGRKAGERALPPGTRPGRDEPAPREDHHQHEAREGKKPQVGHQDRRATFVRQGAADTGFQRSPGVNRPSARSHKDSLTCTNAGQARVARGGVEPPTFRFSGGVAVRLRHVVQTRYHVGGAWAAPSRRRMDWSCTGPVRNTQTSAGRHPMVRADWPVTARALLPPASSSRRTRWGHARMP